MYFIANKREDTEIKRETHTKEKGRDMRGGSHPDLTSTWVRKAGEA